MKAVTLRQLQPKYKNELAKLANNKKIQRYLRDSMPYPYTVNDAAIFIELTRAENPTTTFGIFYEGKLVGVCGVILQTDIYRKSCVVGYWVGEPYWGKGIATNALKLITTYAIEKLQMQRVYTGVFEPNKASIRVLKKCGFVQEAIFVKALIKDGKLFNEVRFAYTV